MVRSMKARSPATWMAQKIVPGASCHGLVDVVEVIIAANHAEYGLHSHGTQMLGQFIAPVPAQVDVQQGNVGLEVHRFAHRLSVGGGGQNAGDVVQDQSRRYLIFSQMSFSSSTINKRYISGRHLVF